MGLLECASGASVWRGYDYYNEKKVKNLTETDAGMFTANVMGTASEPYVVEIDVAHPRKSTCNCPHADGKRIVCKHMVATYFTAYPEEAVRFYREYIARKREIDISRFHTSFLTVCYDCCRPACDYSQFKPI